MSEADQWKLGQALTLDASLDDIEDMPGFKIPLSGAYVFSFESGEAKKIGEHPATQLNFKLVEVKEIVEKDIDINDPDDAPPVIGDIMSLSFMMDNKLGVDALKKVIKPIATGLNLLTENPKMPLHEIYHRSKDAKLLMVVRRKWSEKSQAYFANIKKLAVI